MSEGIIQPNEPVTFQARNPYPKFTRLKSGDCYKVTLEVSEEDWNKLKTMPVNAILEVMLWHHDGDGVSVEEATGAKEKPAKGMYGAYWQAMFASGFHQSPDIQQALRVEKAEQVKEALHQLFDIDSLTYLAPRSFEEWADHNYLSMQVTLSRQAAIKSQQGATV